MKDEGIISLYNLTKCARSTTGLMVGDRKGKKGSVAHWHSTIAFQAYRLVSQARRML